jgi:hypothetical protein
MAIPSEIQALIAQLNQELDETEQEAADGLKLIRPLLSRFPDNVILTQFFAAFNNSLLFVEISRRRIRATIERVSLGDVTTEEIHEAGEDLATELGRVLEAKIGIRQIINRLQRLQ